MARIILRFDAGAGVGLGHLIRMQELGGCLREHGYEVLCFCREIPGFLKPGNLPVELLPTDPMAAQERLSYFFSREKPCWVVFDLQHIPDGNVNLAKESGAKVLALDDYGEEWRKADLVIDSIKHWQREEVKLESFQGIYYCGPSFSIIRDEFNYFTQVKPGQDILLTFGGSDPAGFTQQAILALENCNFSVGVLIGGANPRRKEIQELAGKALKKAEILSDRINIKEIFLNYRLVLTAAGVTLYELARLGVPALAVAYDELQLQTAGNFARAGTLINLGLGQKYRWSELPRKLSQVFRDRSLLEMMRENGPYLVDGKGVARIVKKLLDFPRRD